MKTLALGGTAVQVLVMTAEDEGSARSRVKRARVTVVLSEVELDGSSSKPRLYCSNCGRL